MNPHPSPRRSLLRPGLISESFRVSCVEHGGRATSENPPRQWFDKDNVSLTANLAYPSIWLNVADTAVCITNCCGCVTTTDPTEPGLRIAKLSAGRVWDGICEGLKD